MGTAEWVGLGIWAVGQLGLMVYSIATMRSKVDSATAEITSLRADLKDMGRELRRVAEGLARLEGKTNGMRIGS